MKRILVDIPVTFSATEVVEQRRCPTPRRCPPQAGRPARTALLVALAAWAQGCTHVIADAALIATYAPVANHLRIEVSLSSEDDRLPDSCQLLPADATAAIDGVPLHIMSRGEPRFQSGADGQTPRRIGCKPAFLTVDDIPLSPSGVVSEIRIVTSSGEATLGARNLRARVELRLEKNPAMPGERLSVDVEPADDPTLMDHDDLHVALYRGNTRVADIARADLRLYRRTVSFIVPPLAPGDYELVIHYHGDTLRESQCRGVIDCTVMRAGAPATAILTIGN